MCYQEELWAPQWRAVKQDPINLATTMLPFNIEHKIMWHGVRLDNILSGPLHCIRSAYVHMKECECTCVRLPILAPNCAEDSLLELPFCAQFKYGLKVAFKPCGEELFRQRPWCNVVLVHWCKGGREPWMFTLLPDAVLGDWWGYCPTGPWCHHPVCLTIPLSYYGLMDQGMVRCLVWWCHIVCDNITRKTERNGIVWQPFQASFNV